ncbi:hypothetical protein HPB51_006776 [Rhipicephalus microplus]|uniref:Uncharacterized protein n=1 Tax=Rhipicephalus microplus TaxID=6941 RepID=A0A9J6E899_RHIMP|nr:hypothetical protein HPB51_006776 [Rhipicephalus microplus]
MSLESRPSNSLFKRKEQLKRWEDSETNRVSAEPPADKSPRIKFSDGCVFLAACAAGDTAEVERLLAVGADINTTNVDGLTALHQVRRDPGTHTPHPPHYENKTRKKTCPGKATSRGVTQASDVVREVLGPADNYGRVS